jgi:hypothetical protein
MELNLRGKAAIVTGAKRVAEDYGHPGSPRLVENNPRRAMLIAFLQADNPFEL